VSDLKLLRELGTRSPEEDAGREACSSRNPANPLLLPRGLG
tara:strand:+ start:1135 stop:1257 length:123 start_codon:yes stop_codon:yes gene_type:complete